MRFSFITAGASLFSLTAARLVGVAAPSTIAPGSTFEARLISENYIQSVTDISAAFGIASGDGFPGSLGRFLSGVLLVDQSNQGFKNLTFPITLPDTVQKGGATFGVALTTLYGASAGPLLQQWNVSVEVGDVTSEEYTAYTVYDN